MAASRISRARSRLRSALRTETVGGALLLTAAVVALVLANSPLADWYNDVVALKVGPSALNLDLSLGTWAADGLLAIFFFVVGLELKKEFVVGSLSDPKRAAIPIAAAVGGMIVPAVIFIAVLLAFGSDALEGWAIPVATDIAFALAVLAVFGRGLHPGVRTFLLTLAVVDDLLAITIIAVFYTSTISIGFLAVALIPIGLFAFLVQRRHLGWWYLIPLGIIAWALVHESGVHATVAGVLLGFVVPARQRDDEEESIADRWEHAWRPVSQGFALPVFAFFAAGVTFAGLGDVRDIAGDPIVIGIVAGLVLGKIIGIWLTTLLVTRIGRLQLDDGLGLADVLVVSMLAGIGFTVSLLISELAFEAGSVEAEHAKVAVLIASAIAAVIATTAVLLRKRSSTYLESD